MEDEDEPPDRHQNSNLTERVYDPRIFFSEEGKYIIDERNIFLTPDKSKGEIGILNMTYTINGRPLLAYRIREEGEGEETSDIEINGHRVFQESDKKEYDKKAREDPRISIIDEETVLSCIGYNGYNAISFAANLDRNYKATRIGTTSSNLSLEEVIRLIPNTSPMKKVFEKEMEGTKRRRDAIGETGIILPYNKDTSIFQKKDGQKVVYLRNGNSIQKITVNNLSELEDKQTWKNWYPEIDKHTILNPSDIGDWANFKIGLGSIPKKVIDKEGRERWINVVHGVEDKNNKEYNELVYRTTFVEFNSETWNIKSCIRDPYLGPLENDILIETDPSGTKWQKSICFGNDIVLPKNAKRKPEKGLRRELMILMGVGDNRGGYYITDLEYVLDKLNHPANRIGFAA